MKSRFLIVVGLIAAIIIAASPVGAQKVTKETLPGVTNLSRLETTVACSGAIKPGSVPEIKKMGFVSIINLQEASESSANVEAEAAAAKDAGMRYFHIPFNAASPDPTAADKFLEAITTRGTEPAFIHCAAGGRAATMWFIKRLVVDHWDEDLAAKEAADLGMTSPALKHFALTYAQTHKR